MTTDRDTLAALIGQMIITRHGMHEVADALLAPGGWLAEHDQAVRAEAINGVGDHVRDFWGQPHIARDIYQRARAARATTQPKTDA